jgi:hypothetical protein
LKPFYQNKSSIEDRKWFCLFFHLDQNKHLLLN